MKNNFYKNRFLIIRRVVQLSILLLFIGASHWGWTILKGNLSSAKVFDSFYLADPFAVIQMLFAGRIPSWDIVIGALIIVVFYALFAGRSFCSWVCPMNIITDTAQWLRKRFKLNQNVLKIKKNTRYWMLGLSLVLSIILGVAAFEFISPIGVLHRAIIYGIGISWLSVLGILFLDMFIKKNAWCGHLCPLGAFYSMISHRSMLKIYHKADKCTSCWDCKEVCPEIQVLEIIAKKDGLIKSGECTNCGRCIESCEENALKFSFLKINKS
ncbi:MAG: quinol dehydrogenase ferredoxin subunit NapH [Bacteroidota bacterium]